MSAVIRLEGVSKTFAARGKDAGGSAAVRALEDVTLEVERGEIFGIIGRSGAGKSTLIRTVNMLECPSAGRVIIDGRDITDLPEPELRAVRRRTGMIFQQFNLLSSRTVFDNVALPLRLAGVSKAEVAARVEPLLDLVGLSDKRNRYPAELSGGQKQRVGIARALANEPQILLCDEATSALDPETTKSILALLADINKRLGLTIVLITHEMQVIKEICHSVAVIEDGRIVEQGPAFDVFTDPKTETARAFVRSATDLELPPEMAARVTDRPEGGSPVIRIAFTGAGAHQAVISQLSRRLQIDFNILHARIDYIQGRPFGLMLVEASGAPDQVQAALAALKGYGLKAEVTGYLSHSLRAVG